MNIGVIGGGLMGLTVAYELAKKGDEVVLFEKEPVLGGLASSFDWNGLRLERYYHFICLPDRYLLELIHELGLREELVWRNTKMSFFFQGKLYRWGNPLALLAFPEIDLWGKIRYGLNIVYSKYKKDWRPLDRVRAVDWLKRWLGESNYEFFWRTLLELKFGEYHDQISAAWIWGRINRVARSLQGVKGERYGYLKGGTDRLVSALSQKIVDSGGKIYLGSPVLEIRLANGRIKSLIAGGGEQPVDAVVCTIPLPDFLAIKQELPATYRERLARIENIGIVCAVIRARISLTDNYWLNIKDDRIRLPGLIEYTNLNPLDGTTVIYIPQYAAFPLPPLLSDDARLIGQYLDWLKMINPRFNCTEVIDYKIFRDRHAQPIPETGFMQMLPPLASPVRGLYVADTSFYYPEDRTLDQSIMIGQRLTRLVGENSD